MSLSENEVVQTLLSHRARLLAYLWSIVRDSTLAEDLFQEVSLLALERRDELRDAAALPVWLRKTARFKALAALRNRGGRPTLLSDAALDQLDLAWAAQDESPHDDMKAALTVCLESLSPAAQKIVALRYAQGMSGKSVAESIDRTAHSVYVALSRIHVRLRECIRKQLAKWATSHG
jgi:RNA polymerase sigma-70 factor (ECF subfamily)